MNIAYQFSATVSEADKKFQQACDQRGVDALFYANPQKGPNGETLNLGLCRIGPVDASKRLLVISGTHGIEGYAGAGIQTGWLLRRGAEGLPPDTSMILLHALNPWGMAWNRRENEDNVDIFRNLLYCDHPSETDPLYDLIDDTLDLANWPERNGGWQQRIDAATRKYGEESLTRAIRRGQHHRPLGMTYHGNGPTWSKTILDRIVLDFLQGARLVAVTDIHTGFGEYGQGLVMSYDPPGSEQHNRVEAWFDGDIYNPGACQAGFDPLKRQLVQVVWNIGIRARGVNVTVKPCFNPVVLVTAGRVIRHHQALPVLAKSGMNVRYRHFFYPENDDWKTMVWQRGREVIEKTLQGLHAWADQ